LPLLSLFDDPNGGPENPVFPEPNPEKELLLLFGAPKGKVDDPAFPDGG